MNKESGVINITATKALKILFVDQLSYSCLSSFQKVLARLIFERS